MDAEINNVIYMELNSGPKIANSTCRKTIIAGTIDRDSTVISGPSLGTKAKFLTFNRTQSRAVTGLRIYLHLLGLLDSPLRRCGVKEETSAHILCECEALASL